jgi:hypothetical protein
MAGDLVRFAREQATAGRLAGGGPRSGNMQGTWQGIGADGQGIALVEGQEVRGQLMAGRGKPVGGRCLVRVTPQGNVIQF